MKRIIVLVISSLFFFCLFRDMTMMKTLVCCLVMACAYAISRISPRYLIASKYPLIGLCLLLSPVLIIYPGIRPHAVSAGAAMLLAFYSIALFLVTTCETGKGLYKEITGLTLLYGASSLNLFLTGHSELILPLSISVLLFLFIINRVTHMAAVAAYTVMAVIFLGLKGVPLLGGDLLLNDNERYVLLACAFALLLITFVAYLKRPDLITVLAFFGLLYVSVDLLMSVGAHLRAVLLYQPVLGLLIVGPLVGMVMKGGKERR